MYFVFVASLKKGDSNNCFLANTGSKKVFGKGDRRFVRARVHGWGVHMNNRQKKDEQERKRTDVALLKPRR